MNCCVYQYWTRVALRLRIIDLGKLRISSPSVLIRKIKTILYVRYNNNSDYFEYSELNMVAAEVAKQKTKYLNIVWHSNCIVTNLVLQSLRIYM
jgi:hypothetical protein